MAWNEKVVQCQAVLLSGARKPHESIHGALVGIHANEVFPHLKAALPLNFNVCSSILKQASIMHC
jgi:hypothetical protein